MNTFQAGTQYNDLQGTIAADRSDSNRFVDYLESKNYIRDHEIVAAYKLNIGENQGHDVSEIFITVYFVNKGAFEEKPKDVRGVEFRIEPAKFLSYFKRLDAIMITKGLDLSELRVDVQRID
ncbi:hypothetical protein [Actibacterium sp. 188UL27-1]|uniref:hypothetical protein n=1 Tax=Actibacterium sp. 188UL27-1 TaxID=2786961 RepID=UPI00195B408A|nr:hypothetical protein [Actibacterium sp. 188UL27-1]MBM7068101.1 hypothetical protein [Actibacterium sp. 188UL27-1]